MSQLDDFISSKINAFRNTVNQTAQNVGNTFQTVGNYFNPNVGIVQKPPMSPVKGPVQVPQVKSFWTDIPQINPNQVIENIPKLNLPDFRTPEVRNAPVIGGATAMAGDMIKSFVNAPSNYVQGTMRLTRDVIQPSSTQQKLADVGQIGDAVLNVLPFKGAKAAPAIAEGLGKMGVKNAIKTGAITGGLYGGAQGFMRGLIDNKDLSIGQQLANSGLSGVLNAAVGATLGGATGAAGSLGQRWINTKPSEILGDLQNLRPNASPEEHNILVAQYIRDRLGRFAPKELRDVKFVRDTKINPLTPAETRALDIKYGWLTESRPGLSVKTLTKEEGKALRAVYGEKTGNLQLPESKTNIGQPNSQETILPPQQNQISGPLDKSIPQGAIGLGNQSDRTLVQGNQNLSGNLTQGKLGKAPKLAQEAPQLEGKQQGFPVSSEGKTSQPLSSIANDTRKILADQQTNLAGTTDQKLPLSENLATSKLKQPVESLPTQPIAGGGLPNGQQPPSSSESISQDPVQKLISVLGGAKPIRNQQEAIYSKIRSQQAGALAGIGKQMGGEAGFYKKLGQLKGEMPKVSFESIKKDFTQNELDALFNKVEASPLSVFEKVTAQGGLKKLLGAEGGVIPNKSELALLNEIFPPELTQALLDKRSLVEKLFSIGEGALNLPRAMMATADLSAPLRQGVFLVGRPKQWLPAFRDMFKYAFNENSYKGLQEQIRARPTYSLMREANLAITDMSPILQNREEAFMSNLSENIPLFGNLSRGSNRAYSGFLNKLRADTFDSLVSSAKSQGLPVEGKLLTDIGNFVNTATGRGNLGALQSAATVLNGAFFSPRLMASRLSLLNPLYYVKLDPFVRKEALKSLLTFAGTAGTVFGLSKLGGLEVGTDPRSADFAKIKVGSTRYDILGGFQQYLVLGARLLSGEMVSSTTGKEMQLGEGYNTPTRADILANFFKNKESPVLSFLTSLASGKDALGQKINIPAEVIDMFIPMLAQGIVDLQNEEGALKGAAMSIPNIFGVGTQTYSDPIPMEGKTATGKPNVTWRQPPTIGESLLNKVTGTQISTIPQDQWAPLADARKNEQLWKIKLDSVKKEVLTTEKPQTLVNPITGANVNVYLDNGVVKTKEITSPTVTKTKTQSVKISKPKAPKKLTIKKIRPIKVKAVKPLKFTVKKAKKLKALSYKIPKFKPAKA